MADISDIREAIERIKTLSRHTKKIVKTLQEYEKMLDDRVENAYLLQKKMVEIEKILSASPAPDLKKSLAEWVENEKAATLKAAEDFRFQLGQQLKTMFAKDGIKLRGQYPVLRLGMFTLKISFEFGDAVLFFGPEVEKIRSKISLHPKTIYDTVKQYDSEMRTDPADLESVYQDLVRAYQRCLKTSDRSGGDKLLISEVLREYVFIRQPKQFGIDARRENFREYPRIKLSYMLFQLRDSRMAEQNMRLHVATFDATVDKSRSFWVPDNEDGDGTHYEYISFEEMH
ncbi:MAG: hypothetical protein JSU64_07025 [candidate division WOR-3 bacterium]|nr:MAG: hypothetical protein JSU64_07025 [candidate division WOR-3 bacterium]